MLRSGQGIKESVTQEVLFGFELRDSCLGDMYMLMRYDFI